MSTSFYKSHSIFLFNTKIYKFLHCLITFQTETWNQEKKKKKKFILGQKHEPIFQ